MALGDPENKDNYKESAQTQLVLVIFLITISYTQVVMLNMLIAIMGDTFGNAVEQKDVNTKRSRLQILSDFAPLMTVTSKHKE